MAYNHEYPYTDPYRYNDDWLLNEMKRLADEWAAMKKQFDTLQDAFNDLKAYVENYFSNLDVQVEVENVLNKWLADGTIDSIIGKYVNGYTQALWGGKGAIVIGGNFAMSRTTSGTYLGYTAIRELNIYPIATVLNEGSSMMLNGENNYFHRALAWKNSNSDYLAKGYRYVFIFPERSDTAYTIPQYASNARQIANLFPGCIAINLPYLLPNYDISLEDIAYYNFFNTLSGTGTYIMSFPNLTMPFQYLDNFYTNLTHDILSPSGTYCYSNKLLSTTQFQLVPLRTGAHTYTFPEGGSITFRPRDSMGMTFVVSLSYVLRPNMNDKIQIPVVFGDMEAILPTSNNHFGIMSINNATLTIYTDSSISASGENGHVTLMIPSLTVV